MKSGKSVKSKYLIILAHIAALVTVTAWGTSFLSTKVLMIDGGFTPVEVYVYRFSLAYLVLLLFTLKHLRTHTWRDELTLALCGICNGSLYFLAENYALQLTTTANVSLLSSMSPIFTTLLMAVVFRQRLSPGVALGSLIAFAGVGCIIFSHGDSFEIKPAGDLLALSTAMAWAIYSIAVKRLLPIYSSLFITRKLFFYGVLTAIPILLFQQEPLHIAELFSFAEPKYFINMMFLVVFCSLVAFLLWNEVMKYLGPVTANNYLYMQPLVTMVAAYLLFGEPVYMLGYVGCILIVGGLVIADKLKIGKDRLSRE